MDQEGLADTEAGKGFFCCGHTPEGQGLTGVVNHPPADIVEVHFNDDDLDPTLAEITSFYQLIFTSDTVNNTDDVIVSLFAQHPLLR